MALFYHRKKDNIDKNTANPWNTPIGVDFGEKSKADSQKETYILKSATEDLPAKPKDEEIEVSEEES